MRRFLSLFLVLLAVCLPLTACNGGPTADPYVKIRSPMWLGADPVIAPSGYAMPVPAQQQYVAVPQMQYAAPAPAYGACAPPPAPAYTPGYQYAAPPQPAAGPCNP